MCPQLCVCVCVHLDSLNAEHKFRVWILGHTSLYLHFHSSTEVLNHSGLYKEPGWSQRDGPARIRPKRNPGGLPGRDRWDEPGRLQPNKDPGGWPGGGAGGTDQAGSNPSGGQGGASCLAGS